MKKTLASCIALLLATAAAADDSNLADLSLEQLMEVRVDSVYGASRYEQKVTRAPSSISIVGAEEIKRYGYRTLADVLRSVRGLFVSDDRNYTYLGIRGFHRPGDYTTRVLVTIDGHRINDAVYDSGTIGREGMLDVELIERVEVIRGPSSSIYGSSAFFGVINVVTKRGGQIGGTEVAATMGELNTEALRVTSGHTFDNGAQLLASGSHYRSDGVHRLYIPEFDQRISADPRARDDGVAVGLDDEDAYNFFANLRYGEFSLSGLYIDYYKHVPVASFGTIFNDPDERTKDYRGYLDLKYGHDFNAGWHLSARAFYDDYSYWGAYPYDYAAPGDPPDRVVLRDGTTGQWVGTEWQLTARVSERHTVIVGGEYRGNVQEYQYSYDDLDPRVYHLNDDRSSRILGLFAQDEAQLTDRLTLVAGLRLDRYFDNFGTTVNPRLGLIYDLTADATVKVLAGDAFRAPNPYERYYNEVQPQFPALQPEKIRTYELVYEQYLGQHYRFGAAAYYYDVKNLISQTATADADPYFANLDSVRSLGLELEGEAKFASGTLVRASYAWQKSEDEATGAELSSSPHHLAKLNLSVPVYADRLFASLEVQYHGTSKTIRGGIAPDFAVANLTLLGRKLVQGLELSIGVYNLFDANYGYPGAEDHLQEVLQQNGRTVQGKLTYMF